MSCAFVKLGLVPDCGALYFLPRRVGMGVAKDLIFTGRRISGTEAHALGLVNQVVPDAQLQEVAGGLARQLASAATLAIGMSKRILSQSLELTLRQVSELEAHGQAMLTTTEDHQNARAAFAAKQTPTFNGR
jgi:2-(1,2-epoxy-1,2-dihydrophenyl)acetyl-CoA isomerase